MATYSFETITASQALSVAATDTLMMTPGPGNQVAVLYGASGAITVIAGGRAVEFSSELSAMSFAGRLVLQDGGRLYIGDPSSNTSSATAGSTLSDGLYGGAGADSLDGGGGDDLLQGNSGSDTLVGGAGSDVVYGGQDDDQILSTSAAPPNVPTPPADGSDFVQGNKGNDTIISGLDADTLLGGQGNDRIIGYDGANILNGNLGDDFLYGNGLLLGEDGADTITAYSGNDQVFGGDGNDRIVIYGGYAEGGNGSDYIEVYSGRLTALGGAGDDTLTARFSQAAMNLNGEEGSDSLVGSSSIDTLSGGTGNDTIFGGGSSSVGRDQLSGGDGDDLFLVRNNTFSATTNAPLDAAHIVDWQTNDLVRLLPPSLGPATVSNYRETEASSYDAAYEAAKGISNGTNVAYVSVQVGPDVIVFGMRSLDTTAVILVGRTLNDVAFGNIV